MDSFFGWIVFIAIWFGINKMRESANREDARAALHRRGTSPEPPAVFTAKLEHGRIDEDPASLAEIRFMAVGPFPIRESANAAFVTSVFDKTDGELAFIYSTVDVFQEPSSRCYQRRINAGLLRVGYEFTDWVKIGTIIPVVLQPPRSGRRNLIAVVRLVDTDIPPDIEYGYADGDHPGMLWAKSFEFSYTFTDKGYQELTEHRQEAELLLAKLGVGMAMADGAIAQSENAVLKTWATRALAHLEGDERTRRRDEFNTASREAHREARSGGINLDAVLQRLAIIADIATKYEAIELCFDVMAADGVAHANELAKIDQVIRTLGLDPDEVRKLRDQKLTGLDLSSTAHGAVEDLIGIDPTWSEDEIRKYLRAEFSKWNNRLSTLAPGTERENAQRIIEQIAAARQKHG